jgi:hypothetical protein
MVDMQFLPVRADFGPDREQGSIVGQLLSLSMRMNISRYGSIGTQPNSRRWRGDFDCRWGESGRGDYRF